MTADVPVKHNRIENSAGKLENYPRKVRNAK